jgi:hypothetical protein
VTDALYILCGLAVLGVGIGMGTSRRSELSSTVMVEWINEDLSGHIAYHAYDHTGDFERPDPSSAGIPLYAVTAPIGAVGLAAWRLQSLLLTALGATFIAAAAGLLSGDWILATLLFLLANTSIRGGSTQLRRWREIREALTHVSRDREATTAAILKAGADEAIQSGLRTGLVSIVMAAAAQMVPPREQGWVGAGLAIALGIAAATVGLQTVLT